MIVSSKRRSSFVCTNELRSETPSEPGGLCEVAVVVEVVVGRDGRRRDDGRASHRGRSCRGVVVGRRGSRGKGRSRRNHGSGHGGGLRGGGDGHGRRLTEAEGDGESGEDLATVARHDVHRAAERHEVDVLAVAPVEAEGKGDEPVRERDRRRRARTGRTTGVIADHPRVGEVAHGLEAGERVRSHVGPEVEHEGDGLAGRREVDRDAGLTHVAAHVVDAGCAQRSEDHRRTSVQPHDVVEPVPGGEPGLGERRGAAEIGNRCPAAGDPGPEAELPAVGAAALAPQVVDVTLEGAHLPRERTDLPGVSLEHDALLSLLLLNLIHPHVGGAEVDGVDPVRRMEQKLDDAGVQRRTIVRDVSVACLGTRHSSSIRRGGRVGVDGHHAVGVRDERRHPADLVHTRAKRGETGLVDSLGVLNLDPCLLGDEIPHAHEGVVRGPPVDEGDPDDRNTLSARAAGAIDPGRGPNAGLTARDPGVARRAAHVAHGLRAPDAARNRDPPRLRALTVAVAAALGELGAEGLHLRGMVGVAGRLHRVEGLLGLYRVDAARGAARQRLHDAVRQRGPLCTRRRGTGRRARKVGARSNSRARLPEVGQILSERAVRRAQPHRDGHHGRRYEHRNLLHDLSSA